MMDNDLSGACVLILRCNDSLTKSMYEMYNEVETEETDKRSLKSEIKVGIWIFESLL